MKAKTIGLFWDNEDVRFSKRKEVLRDHGWVQVEPGWWAESYLINSTADVRDVAYPVELAYRQANNEKSEPPEPVWLSPDYLPGLEQSKCFNVDMFSDSELVEAANSYMVTDRQHELVFDVECYSNYFLVAFCSIKLNKVVMFEFTNSNNHRLQHVKLKWVFDNFCVIGFNSSAYDIPMVSLALGGLSTHELKTASDLLIKHNKRPYEVLKIYKKRLIKNTNHIDILEPAPQSASLKMYGGRLHCQKLQDLPFQPDVVLNDSQIYITRFYCINDLRLTMALKTSLAKDLVLREKMSAEYKTDLRSKSDAQIAETVIRQLVGNIKPPPVLPGTSFHYKTPAFIDFKTPLMNEALQKIKTTRFQISESGAVSLPKDIADLHIAIGDSVYRMGIGGLHSWEKSISHHTDNDCFLVDRDVVSYYPAIILNLGLYPKHLGPAFLHIYSDFVTRRLKAKAEKNKVIADSLKIAINGGFGKLANRYSILYSPDLLIQVTLTGQLSLLMLIERLEMADIPVVSANTDGVVIKCPYSKEDELNRIVNQWEFETKFQTEATYYKSLYSRDVNNYIAIKADKPEAKTKGIFADSSLQKSPQNEICVDAIRAFLLHQTPINETIMACDDVTKFVSVRNVKGGGVKIYGKGEPGLYLGKSIRWYYATGQVGKIVYATSGNTVSKTLGACPIMDLPDTLPIDIDYDWYIKETRSMLDDIGFVTG